MNTPPVASFERKAGLLVVTVHGEFAPTWFESLIASLPDKISEYSARAVLVDVRLGTSDFSFLNRYHAGLVAANSRIKIPIALVGNDSFVDPKRIGELVARNRGVNVRVYTDLAKATAWLDSFLSDTQPDAD